MPLERGISISAFAPGREHPPSLGAFSAAAALGEPLAAEASTPTPTSTSTLTITRSKKPFRSHMKLERRSSWLSSALSSDTLPFAVVDIEIEERRRSLRSLLLSLGSALFYSICAISMNFTNKAALMVFPFANTLLFVQMLAALAIVFPLKAFGIIYFPPLNVQKARALLPLTALYAGNVSCALLGLRVLNVPMYSTLKRLTPMVVLLAKWRMTKTLPSRGICMSVVIVVLGCFIAGSGDLAFDLRGYTFAFASCMLQAAYLLLVERTGAKQGVSTSELLAYNAVLSLPCIFGVMIISGEAFTAIPALYTAISQHGIMHIIGLLVVCSVSGVALNFSMFLCTLLNSALTTTIVGTLKGVIVTLLGFFLLGGVKYKSAINIFGIVVNACGGTMYSIVKYKAKLSSSSSTSCSSSSSSPFSRQKITLPVSPPSFSPRAFINNTIAHSKRDCFDGNIDSPSSVLPGHHHPLDNGGGSQNSIRRSLDGTTFYSPSFGKPPLPPKYQALRVEV